MVDHYPVQGVEFVECTQALLAKGNGYNPAILVRIEIGRQADGSIMLTSRGGRTGTLFKSVEPVMIPGDEWDHRPYDPCDHFVLTRWTFAKVGWLPRDNG